VAPAPPASSKKGLYNKDDFGIDLDARTVTCPAGNVAAIPTRRPGDRIKVGFGSLCATCPLLSRCTTSASVRSIDINARRGAPGLSSGRPLERRFP
jgi:hypothetical protein